jgi:hypothetical protein
MCRDVVSNTKIVENITKMKSIHSLCLKLLHFFAASEDFRPEHVAVQVDAGVALSPLCLAPKASRRTSPPARPPQQISPMHKSVLGIFNSRNLLSPHLSHTHSAPRSIAAFLGARRIKQSLFVFSLSFYIVIFILRFHWPLLLFSIEFVSVRSLVILRASTVCFRCFWDAFFL